MNVTRYILVFHILAHALPPTQTVSLKLEASAVNNDVETLTVTKYKLITSRWTDGS